MILTKYGAIEYFEFTQNIYNKMPGCEIMRNNEEDCGVFFYDRYAYAANNHVLGRVEINDDLPLTIPMFWSYNRKDDDEKKVIRDRALLNIKGLCINDCGIGKLLSENIPANFNKIISRYYENSIYIKKNQLINIIESAYNSEAKRVKIILEMVASNGSLKVNMKPLKKSTSVFEHSEEVDMVYLYNRHKNRYLNNTSFSVHLIYLYHILLEGFKEYDIIKIKFSSNKKIPVVFQARNKTMGKTEVHWIVCQII